MTTTGTTTDGSSADVETSSGAPSGSRERRGRFTSRMGRGVRRGLTVRTRITAAVALLTALGLASAGALVYLLGVQQAKEGVRDDVDQEMAELVQLQERGIDPVTKARFDSYQRLVRVFLLRNVPSPSEMMVGAWDGRIQLSSASSRSELRSEPAFVDAVLERVETGGSTTIDSPRLGEVYLEVLPLAAGSDRGAFAVAFFVDDETDALMSTMRTYALAALVALLVVSGVAFWVAGRLLSPVRTLHETAQDITETDLSRRIPVVSNDDLGDLTTTFNAMLDRLDGAFRGQRAFLDDAGHELRTPLTILQGHLELVDPADPDDVRRTRDLLLDETERMSRLVEDMILLTKSERPGFVVPSAVRADELTDRVADKVRGLADRVWVVDGRADVEVEVDEQRLTQALVQLAQNAVKHTGATDTVAIGSALGAGGTVRFWVRDTGPGVPDAEKSAIFQRFTRGTDAVHDEGSGLGLSIVSAIAAAHGGTAHVEDATPPGALFVITLPRQRKDASWRAS